MHITRTGLTIFALLAGALSTPFIVQAGQAGQGGQAGEGARPVPTQEVQRVLGTWGQHSRKAAEAMIEKYGPPHEVTLSMLIWNNNGPWLRTTVYREEIEHRFPMDHIDVLEQVVAFKVPPPKFTELAQYDGSVVAERTNGELSARCDKEEANFLALNLAHDIIEDKRDIDDARAYYAQAIQKLMAGEPDEYTQGLRFRPMSPAEARDPDQPAQPSARTREAGAPRDSDR